MPEMWRHPVTGAALEPRRLTEEQWRRKTDGMNRLGRAIHETFGLRTQYHPHADSHVDTEEHIYRFLDCTQPKDVSLCLDTGHVSYCGGDNLNIINKYPERIGYLHLKQVDPYVGAQVKTEDLSFGEAVQRGVMIEPPGGIPDLPAVLHAVERLGVDIFAIVEQDMFGCAPDKPLPIARRTRHYLATCGARTMQFA
jgi:inosose dehydratase